MRSKLNMVDGHTHIHTYIHTLTQTLTHREKARLQLTFPCVLSTDVSLKFP